MNKSVKLFFTIYYCETYIRKMPKLIFYLLSCVINYVRGVVYPNFFIVVVWGVKNVCKIYYGRFIIYTLEKRRYNSQNERIRKKMKAQKSRTRKEKKAKSSRK